MTVWCKFGRCFPLKIKMLFFGQTWIVCRKYFQNSSYESNKKFPARSWVDTLLCVSVRWKSSYWRIQVPTKSKRTSFYFKWYRHWKRFKGAQSWIFWHEFWRESQSKTTICANSFRHFEVCFSSNWKFNFLICGRSSRGAEKFGALQEFQIPAGTDLSERFSMANQHTILELIQKTMKVLNLRFSFLTKIEIDAGKAGVAAIRHVSLTQFHDRKLVT